MFLKRILLLIFICSYLNAKEKITLYPDWLDQFQFAGYYIAKEKGFYDDFGLDVEIQPFNQNINIVDKVLNNSATYGIGKSSLILEKYNNKDLVFISSIFQESPLILLSLKNKSINNISDLKNKKIMITNDAIESATIKSILNSDKGFDISNIDIIKHSGNIEDLINNKVDVMACYLSNEPYTLSKKGIDFNYFSTNYLNLNFYEGIIFTSQTEVLSNPFRVQSFDKASLKGWEYAFENVEESAKIIFEKYNSQNRTLDELIYEGNVLKDLAKFDNGLLGDINYNRIEDIKKFYTYSGINKSLNSFNSQSIIFNKEYLVLNSSQKNYLSRNQFTLLIKDSNIPFSFKVDNELKGFEIDIWNLLSEKLSKPFSSEEVLLNQQLNIFSNTIKANFIYSYEKPAKKDKVYTKALAPIPLVLATNRDKGFVTDLKSFENIKIGILSSLNIKGKLLSLYPKIEFVEFETDNLGLMSLSKNEIYGYVNNIYSLNSSINKNNFKDIKINSALNLSINSYLEIENKDREFKEILDLAIAKLKSDEINSIFNSYSQIFIKEDINYEEFLKIAIPFLLIIALILYLNFKLYKEIKLRKKAENELIELATNDPLTNIYNRRKIEEICEYEIKLADRYNTPFSIIFFDLNSFKPINDNFGHHAGDEVLIKVANNISKHIRNSDSFGRWGGDEFLIALPQTNIYQANSLINILQTHLLHIKFDFDKNLKISCSFGVCEYKENSSLEDMLKEADEIMYEEKAKHKASKKA
ncbi:diguanylate cyclase [Arcobacter vandammei]|uniref:diguanylate cyclase n=1 Tax=Arcobacter vandammei TaxID=2782243 RepID=UPI0018DF9012|nr:diguanylate cyclase [Arcobacter vandammei]